MTTNSSKSPPPAFRRVDARGAEVLRLHPALASYWRSLLAMAIVFLLWRSDKAIFDALMELFGIPPRMSVIGLMLGLAPIAAHMAGTT